MSEPIPASTPVTVPETTADAALIALIGLIYTDPLAEPLTENPGFFLHPSDLAIRYSGKRKGVRQLEAARSLFGGTVTEEESYSPHTIGQKLTTTWHGFPLSVSVVIPREDELAELRKQLAELQAVQAAAGQDVTA